MIVSLEAIFLSTFVMISQNRADAKRQVVADLEWRTVREEGKQNRQLIDLPNSSSVGRGRSTPSRGTDRTPRGERADGGSLGLRHRWSGSPAAWRFLELM